MELRDRHLSQGITEATNSLAPPAAVFEERIRVEAQEAQQAYEPSEGNTDGLLQAVLAGLPEHDEARKLADLAAAGGSSLKVNWEDVLLDVEGLKAFLEPRLRRRSCRTSCNSHTQLPEPGVHPLTTRNTRLRTRSQQRQLRVGTG